VQLLPQRPGEADCIYFCKYGATCKYHHPTNSFNLESNMCRSTNQQQQQTHFVDGRERSISDPSILLNHNIHHPSRKQEGPVATHVLYRSEGSTVVVPVNQGSAFQHLRSNTVPNTYTHDIHRKGGGKYRKPEHSSRNSSPLSYDKGSSSIEFIPASFHHHTQVHHTRDSSPVHEQPLSHNEPEDAGWRGYHPSKHEEKESEGDRSHMDRTHSMSSFRSNSYTRTSSSDDIAGSHYQQRSSTYNNNVDSSRMNKEYYEQNFNYVPQDALSTSPNELGRQWSSVSTSSSCQSNDHTWDDSSIKRSQDMCCGDSAYLSTSPPEDLPRHEPPSQPITISSKNVHLMANNSRRGQAPNYDDGLSMMTSALLTMLDSPEEEDEHKDVPHHEETNSFYSDLGSRNGSPPPSSNGSKTKFDINDQSYTWFSNFPGLDPGMNDPSGPHTDVGVDTLRHGDNIFKPFTTMEDGGDTSPRWLDQSSAIPNLERNSQAVSALHASSASAASSQLFLPL